MVEDECVGSLYALCALSMTLALHFFFVKVFSDCRTNEARPVTTDWVMAMG